MPLYNPPVTSGSIARGFILPTDASYGAAGDGIFNTSTPGTDDSVALQAAIDAAATNNLPLHLGGKGYYIARAQMGRTTAGNLTLVGPGTIYWRRGTNGIPFRFEPVTGTVKSITAKSNVVIPGALNGTPCTRLTLAAGDENSFTIGDVVIIHSTDDLPLDTTLTATNCKQAETLTIITIDTTNHYIYLNGILEYPLTTSPTITRIDQTSKLRIYGGVKFMCVDSITASVASLSPNGGRGIAAVLVAGANAPEVEVEVDTSPSRGVMIVGCYRARVKATLWRLRDDTGDTAYGYGVSVAGCSRHTNVEVYGGFLRHGFTTNCYPDSNGSSFVWSGGPRDTKVTGDIARASASAFDTHKECYDLHLWDISADNTASDDTGSDQLVKYIFQDRGVRTTIAGLKQKGYPSILYVEPQATTFQYLSQYTGIIATGGAAEETALGADQAFISFADQGTVARDSMTIEIRNSHLANFGHNIGTNVPRLIWRDVWFRDWSTMRHNGHVTGATYANTKLSGSEYYNCVRENTNTGANAEGMRWTSGGRGVLHNVKFIGLYENAACFRHSGGSGTVVIDYDGVVSDQGYAPYQVVAGGTLTVTQGGLVKRVQNPHTGGRPPATSTDGTDTTPVVTETYICAMPIQADMFVTGVRILNGSAVAGNIKLALHTPTGVFMIATASTAAAGTAVYQEIALTAPTCLSGPGTYYVTLQCDNTGNRFRSHLFGAFAAAKKTGETYGTPTTITVPTTFTASLGPIATLY